MPDLQIELTAAALCPDLVRLTATVRNKGSAAALPGVPVDFFRTDVNPPVHLGTLNTTTMILPGGWERLTFVYDEAEIGVDMMFRTLVNDANVVEECNSANNANIVGPVHCRVVY